LVSEQFETIVVERPDPAVTRIVMNRPEARNAQNLQMTYDLNAAFDKAVQDYNVGIRTFPNNLTAMAFGYKEKPNFSVENEKEISTAPKVDFNPPPSPAAAPSK